MKKLLSICIITLLTTLLTAQVSKTINVATAGTLTNLLTSTEKATVTNLTVTGNIDATDIKCMRDELNILAALDISSVSIMAYSGTAGTYNSYYSYLTNQIPVYSFYNSSSNLGKSTLTSIILPNSIVSINESAFYKCSGLTNITIPNTVTSISSNSFNNCTGLITATISNNITSIGSSAFNNCYNLTNIVIPNSLTSLNQAVFQNCSSIESITIGNSVTTLGMQLFENCIGIKTIHSLSVTPPVVNSYCFRNVSSITAIYVPAGSVAAYKAAAGWSSFSSIIVSNSTIQCRLSIKDAVSGTINLLCSYGSTPSFDFSPASGWQVNTIFYNTTDVTNSLVNGVYTIPPITANALLNVSFVSIATGAPELINNRVKVYSTNSEIIVDGTYDGEIVTLYTVNGKQIQSVMSKGERLNLTVDSNTIYLVKTGEKIYKVIL